MTCRPDLEFGVDTFRRDFQFSALRDFNRLARLVSRGSFGAFNLLHHIKTLEHFAKDNMTAVQPRCNDCGNEEL